MQDRVKWGGADHLVPYIPMMERIVSIPKAVAAYGGSRALARRIGRPFQTVHGWTLPGRRVVPLAQVLISAAGEEDGIDVWQAETPSLARTKMPQKTFQDMPWLKQRLYDLGKKSSGLARHLGVAAPRVYEMIGGRRRFQPEEIERTAAYLEWSVGELLSRLPEDQRIVPVTLPEPDPAEQETLEVLFQLLVDLEIKVAKMEASWEED